MGKTNPKTKSRIRRHRTIRKNLSGTSDRPRLAVFRSAKNIYVQIIDDESGCTLASASSLSKELKGKTSGGNKEGAKAVGTLIAKKCKKRFSIFLEYPKRKRMQSLDFYCPR